MCNEHHHDHEHLHHDHDHHGHEHYNHEHSHSHSHAVPQSVDIIRQMALLEKLLEHWKVHNIEHNQEYQKWADAMKTADYPDIAYAIQKAVNAVNQANEALSEALALVESENQDV